MQNPKNLLSTPMTAREIARRLGVSQPTVSRVLSGAPGYRYSEETRQRILEEAERVGYRPHAVGRSLRERRTRVIGFYSLYGHLDARNPFLAEIIGGLQRSCSESRHFLLLQTFLPGTPPNEVFGELICGRTDALVLHTRIEDPLVEQLAGASVPVVAIADEVPGLPSVVCDDRGGMQQAIEHLEERGHRRIAFLHPTVALASTEARREAYREQMIQRGWEPLCMPITFEKAEPVLEILRTMPERPTAVCCWNDLTALNLLRACRASGVRVPEDLAIVGFDGLLDVRIMALCLTTVVANWSGVTKTALEVLHAIMRGEQVPSVTTLPVTLRIGETA